ncbi:RICIN domain-containing protein [Streptomyces sp. NPDC085932]|uniref:RICIN domain-containing protein n=1 Tax=Streptomyces sp. NPDC085932 TaxID=3365741 RepID=UPI0037D38818
MNDSVIHSRRQRPPFGRGVASGRTSRVAILSVLVALLSGLLAWVSPTSVEAAPFERIYYTPELRVAPKKYAQAWKALCPRGTNLKRDKLGNTEGAGKAGNWPTISLSKTYPGNVDSREGLVFVFSNLSVSQHNNVKFRYTCVGIPDGDQPDTLPNLEDDCTLNADSCNVEVLGEATKWVTHSKMKGQNCSAEDDPSPTSLNQTYDHSATTTFAVMNGSETSYEVNFSHPKYGFGASIGQSLSQQYTTTWSTTETDRRSFGGDIPRGYIGEVSFRERVREVTTRLTVNYKDGIEVYPVHFSNGSKTGAGQSSRHQADVVVRNTMLDENGFDGQWVFSTQPMTDAQQLEICEGRPVWHPEPQPDRSYYINVRGGNYDSAGAHSENVIDMAYASTDDDTPAHLYPWHGQDNQKWELKDWDGDGTFAIVQGKSRKCLDIREAPHYIHVDQDGGSKAVKLGDDVVVQKPCLYSDAESDYRQEWRTRKIGPENTYALVNDRTNQVISLSANACHKDRLIVRYHQETLVMRDYWDGGNALGGDSCQAFTFTRAQVETRTTEPVFRIIRAGD